MDNFTNIGKAVLIQSLGLQKNYIEIAESNVDVIDYNNEFCKDCKHCALLGAFPEESAEYQKSKLACENCPRRIYTTETVYKKIYHNERNKYGYKPRLKTNAIKLFILLHFYHPDKFGIIKDIDVRVLTKQLKCDLKTVWNNLNILTKFSYISYAKTDTYSINLCLCDYESYYLPANQGGRGFFVLSRQLLDEILNINNLLALRIHLRELIDIDNLNIKGPFTAVSKTYKELKLSLPEYCKPGIIKNALLNYNNIFSINFKEHSIRFEINDNFNARKQKTEFYNEYITQFNDFINDFNNTVSYINVNNAKLDHYKQFFNLSNEALIHVDHFKLLSLRDYEIEDLASLSIQYSFDIVIDALSDVYKEYILYNRKIVNLGGLLRTIIQKQYLISKKAA